VPKKKAGAWLNLNSGDHLCRRFRSIQTAKKRLMSSPCEIVLVLSKEYLFNMGAWRDKWSI